MKSFQIDNWCPVRWAARLTLGAVFLLANACHTAQGVKQDTKNALDATGRGLQNGANKIDGHEQYDSKNEVKKDVQSRN